MGIKFFEGKVLKFSFKTFGAVFSVEDPARVVVDESLHVTYVSLVVI